MTHYKHANVLLFHPKQKMIRKPRQIHSPQVAFIYAKTSRLVRGPLEKVSKLSVKIIRQVGSSNPFVIIHDLGNVGVDKPVKSNPHRAGDAA
jgi:hypothetical protein